MKEKTIVYQEHINNNLYIEIYACDNDIFIVDTNGHTCVGMVQKLDSNNFRVCLNEWFDKNTKRHKGRSNKLFNHTEKWFLYMLEKYYFNKEN